MQHTKQIEHYSNQNQQVSLAKENLKLASVHLLTAQSLTTSISEPDASDREELEHFIRSNFKRVHNAEVHHFMPKLMSLRDFNGKLLAVCGLRHANQSQLFLETYLDTPIDALLSQHHDVQVNREAILEVGNLAVAEPANIRSLLANISLYLHSTHSEWAVFTGISTLRNSLTKLNMTLHTLGEASINRIPEHERDSWGTYYNERPQVMAIRRSQPI